MKCERCGREMTLAPGIDYYCTTPACVIEDKRSFKSLRANIRNDDDAAIKAAELRGWQQAIDSVRGSLRDYPNAGGDIGIMQEIGRLKNEFALEMIKTPDFW